MERKYPNLCKRAGFEMLMVHGGHGWLGPMSRFSTN
jgi:hypothetical protein